MTGTENSGVMSNTRAFVVNHGTYQPESRGSKGACARRSLAPQSINPDTVTVSRSSPVRTRDEVVPSGVKPNMRTVVLGGANGGTADGGDCQKLMDVGVLIQYKYSHVHPSATCHHARWSCGRVTRVLV